MGATDDWARPGRVFRVFLSSTATDLAAHREAVIEALHRLDRVKPVYQEAFGSRGPGTVGECKRLAGESDVLIVVVAHRYGWVPTVAEGGDKTSSITELEVAAALSADPPRPVLGFVVDDAFGWAQAKEQDALLDAGDDPGELLEIKRRIDGLKAFKRDLATRIRDLFTTPTDLSAKVVTSVTNELQRLELATARVVEAGPRPAKALSLLIRTAEFASIIEDRTRSFVGREHVFAAVDDALADDDFQSGYIVIQGEPGIGKTAIIGQLVKSRHLIHHFNVAPLGIRSPQAFLSNVCAQLIVRYGLGHATVPPEATQDGGFLSRLLTEAAADPARHPIVVAIDALDEAEDTGLPTGANRLFLPPSLPTGVYIVLTTREEKDYRLSVARRRDFYLRDDDPRNVDDVRTYVRDFVMGHHDQMRTRAEGWGVTEDEFVDVITAKSEGNFMYLVHVLRDIASGQLTAANVNDIRRLPQGLKDYYRRHWNDMRSVDPEQFRRYQQPVVCLLATAREPVSVAQLLDWTRRFWERRNWDPASLDPLAVKDVLAVWRQFLNTEVVEGQDRYRVYHASFQDFLADEVSLVTFHDTIGDAALAKIPGFAEP